MQTIVFILLSLMLAMPAIAEEARPVPTEAEPFVLLLMAAKNADAMGMRGAYSMRIRDDREQGDWDKNLRQAKVSLARMFGDYALADFSYVFSGDQREGAVKVMYRDVEQFSIPVIWESDGWKLNER
jgi:hypothetical protein